MKVSISWLKEYVPIDTDVPSLAEALTMAGLEVDHISDRYEYLNSVHVACVESIAFHPNADKLKICTVNIGDTTLSIVCGAPNVKEEMLVACALPGTHLPNGAIIKKSTIRGQESHGMLCSELELGLGSDGSGIMVLNDTLSIGTPLNKALGLQDSMIEIDLTPNRSDCLSLTGVAREIAAFQNRRITYPEINLPAAIDDITAHTSVVIEDPDLCHRYAAQLVFDITVAPSPLWLQDRLKSVGLSPINNIVDITNFVMLETGQPLHAFDFDHLEENRIIVRRAHANEKFVTLDGKERQLSPEMLMICDGKKPVALAGVMGGMNSEIEQTTKRVLLESACFDAVCVRKTSKKLGINTDASHRFERGVDPNATIYALNRAAQLIAEIGDGQLIRGIIDNCPKPFQPISIQLNTDYTNKLLGLNIATQDIKQYLESIEFKTKTINPDGLEVIPPSFRVDVTRPEDLIEEIARLSGYNNIPTTFPKISAINRIPSTDLVLRNRIKDALMGLGFTETINYSFISSQSCDRLKMDIDDDRRNHVVILNPITEEQSVMRTSLVPCLLETASRNISKQTKHLKIFEVGKTFFAAETQEQPKEVMIVAGLWTGLKSCSSWHGKDEPCDYYDIKGCVEALFENLSLDNIRFTRIPADPKDYYQPGYSARIIRDETVLGTVGKIRASVSAAYNIKQDIFAFELNVNKLFRLVPVSLKAKPLAKFPAMSRDITIIVDEQIESGDIMEYIDRMRNAFIECVKIFDMYVGDPIPEGKKSISIRVTYRSLEKTLEYDEVNSIHMRLTDNMVNRYNAALPV